MRVPRLPTPGLLLVAALAALGAAAPSADAGTIIGRVDATPSKFLPETVVYVKSVKVPTTPKRVAVDQKNLKFFPHVLAINVGDTVEFLNHDAVEHNVFTPDNEGFNLGMIKPKSAGSYTFEQAGVYTQLCSVHAEMLAYVFVGENPFHAVVDANGTYRIDQLPPGTYTLAVWNSHLKASERAVTVVEGKPAEVSFSVRR